MKIAWPMLVFSFFLCIISVIEVMREGGTADRGAFMAAKTDGKEEETA